VAPAHIAVIKARANAARASAVEQALIKAQAVRYQHPAPPKREQLDQAYADAMRDAAKAFPNNDHVQVLYAESLMDLSPWDYWEAGGGTPKGRNADMVDALERVLERNPTHPGAAHYATSTRWKRPAIPARRAGSARAGAASAGRRPHGAHAVASTTAWACTRTRCNPTSMRWRSMKILRQTIQRCDLQGRLLPAQHPLRDGVRADGRRRQAGAGRSGETGPGAHRRHGQGDGRDAVGQSLALLFACAVQQPGHAGRAARSRQGPGDRASDVALRPRHRLRAKAC
jgi:hypothetical protein